ncbi:hypothetical protein BGZ54_003150 [Gamsiella multidivaricata]|nr:hypothetical protein BGZ54_003150 [Gamsiella multidivaricata]
MDMDNNRDKDRHTDADNHVMHDSHDEYGAQKAMLPSHSHRGSNTRRGANANANPADQEEGEEDEDDENLAEDQQLLLPHHHHTSPSSSFSSSNIQSSISVQNYSEPHRPMTCSRSPPSSTPYTQESQMRYPPPPLSQDQEPIPHNYTTASKKPWSNMFSRLLPGSSSSSSSASASGSLDRQALASRIDHDSDSDSDRDDDHHHHRTDHVALTMPTSTPALGDSASGNGSDSEERRCRICLETDDDKDSESGQLISPCLCKGSSRYIHLGCLEKWRALSPRKESAFQCDTCHYTYSFSRPWMANVLGHAWFLHIITGIMFATVCYTAAWGGRELNQNGVWEWKRIFIDDPHRETTTAFGLDWMDLVYL